MSVKAASDWQAYWQQAVAKGDSYRGGTDHPAIAQFWHNFFKNTLIDAKSDARRLNLVDIASGNGAVFQHALDGAQAERLCPFCVDISAPAVANVCAHWPEVAGIVADASCLPLGNASVDIVVSQFGIEYAGIDAICAAANAIKPGGKLALLLHHRGGAIYRECADNYAAITAVNDAGFLQGAIEMFDCAFDVLEGKDRSAYERTSHRLIPAFRAMEEIMRKFGKRVAGDTVRRLYLDVDHIHTNLPRFNRADIDTWLKRAVVEMDSYAGRMHSMCEAALDEVTINTVADRFRQTGFSVCSKEAIGASEQSLPLAWSLIAQKTRE